MASIEKRGENSFRFVVFVKEDKTGKQVKKTMTYKPTNTAPSKVKKEVQEAAADFERRVREGRYYDGGNMTFEKFATDVWLPNWAQSHLTAGEVEAYKRNLELHAFPFFGDVKIAKLQAVQVQSMITKLTEQGLAAGTVRRVVAAVSDVLEYGYKMNLLEENVTRRCELPKVQINEGTADHLRFFDRDQAQRFLSAITGAEEYNGYYSCSLQLRVFYNLALYSGCRRGELIALTWSDIDFSGHQINIVKAAKKVQNNVITKTPKTRAGVRKIALPRSCFDLLRQWQKEQEAYRLSVGELWQGEQDMKKQSVFIETIQGPGLRMYPDTPSKQFKKILKGYNRSIEARASAAKSDTERDQILSEKLPEITLHELRHSSATWLIGSGVDIETVRKRLGHSKASVTLDVYAHAIPSKDQEAADVLESVFSGGGDQADRKKA